MCNGYINNYLSRSNIVRRIQYLLTCIILLVFFNLAAAQDIIAPPSLGEQTKGESASLESANKTPVENLNQASEQADSNTEEQSTTNLFGETIISEHRYENGQVYQIELEHANGSKQFINQGIDNGQIESTIKNDTQKTPNIAKWKLGSW